MKMNWLLRVNLKFYLKELKKRGSDPVVFKTMDSMLDEKQSEEALKIEVSALEKQVTTINAESNSTIGSAEHSPAPLASGMLDCFWLLGVCYQFGLGVTQDLNRAVLLYQKAAAHKHSEAMTNLGVCYDSGIVVPEDANRAAELYQQAANLGNVRAMSNLAGCYSDGFGVTQNSEQSLKLYQNAVSCEYPPAIFCLGLSYEDGNIVPQDLEKAIEFYQMAVSLQYPEAISHLAGLYERGIGINKDIKHAVELYQQAASLDHIESIMTLAHIYANGIEDIPKDDKRSVALYKQAAELGDAAALNNLGCCYQHGLGVSKDLKRAFDLFQKSAKLNNPNSLYNLGVFYSNGEYVPKDIKRAIELFEQAYALGFREAAHAIGVCYAEGGNEVEKDLNKAFILQHKAADLGFVDAIMAIAKFCISENVVFKDNTRSAELYSQAAILGNPVARYNLGKLYQSGTGVIINLKRAALLYQAAMNDDYLAAKEELTTLSSKNPSLFIPDLDNAFQYYQEHSDYGMLGFCQQIGIGTIRDANKALKNFILAIQPNTFCHFDLLLCYKTIAAKTKEAILKTFSDSLLSANENDTMRCDKLRNLAYLYERGGPNFDQNLYHALTHYQSIKANDAYAREKCIQYSFLPAFQNATKLALAEYQFNEAIASIIAEYGYELPKPG